MLSASLQPGFEAVFEELLNTATALADPATYGPSEVSWIERMHGLSALRLQSDLRGAISVSSSTESVWVESVMIHGNPFKIEAAGPVTKRVEAGSSRRASQRFRRARRASGPPTSDEGRRA